MNKFQVQKLGLDAGDDDTDDWFEAAVKKKEEDEKRLNMDFLLDQMKKVLKYFELLNLIHIHNFRLDAKRELEALRAKEEKIVELRKKRQIVKQSQVQKVDAGKGCYTNYVTDFLKFLILQVLYIVLEVSFYFIIK